MPDPSRTLEGPWSDEPAIRAGVGTLTLVDGLTFAISASAGDMTGGSTGLIAADTRHLDRLVLSIDGHRVQPLGTALLGPASARFHALARGTRGDIEVTRHRAVDRGALVEVITLDWWGEGAHTVFVQLEICSDFADIFDIRGGEAVPPSRPAVHDGPGRLLLDDAGLGRCTRVELVPAPHDRAGAACWHATVRRDFPWRLRVTARPSGAGIGDGRPVAVAVARAGDAAPMVWSQPAALGEACGRSLADLEILSVPDPLAPGETLTAAGIPWFVALFGRDSLITAHQARAFVPGAQVAAARTLARRLGQRDDPGNDEQPGKVLHEVRLTPKPWLGSGTSAGGRPYFGSVDATPLFLMAYGEAFRWGAPRAALEQLLPAVYAALDWLEGPADMDGDGLIEYAPSGPASLRNQGWKDSHDSILFADGRLAEPPIALVEAQGYAYRARRDVAPVLRFLGEAGRAAQLEADAELLRTRIRASMWCPPTAAMPGYFAMGLDAGKRRIDAVASNMGHLLWSGVPSAGEAGEVVQHLTSATMSTGWGIRTLSRTMPGYDPLSYHRGSVWPHDTAICIEGLRLYGFTDEAMSLASGLIAAMRRFGNRLPELFGGHPRRPDDVPVPYPTACQPQAWAAGVPLQLVTVCLGLQPDVPAGEVVVAPALPHGVDALTVRGLPLARGVLSLDVRRDRGLRILEAPPDVAIHVLPA